MDTTYTDVLEYKLNDSRYNSKLQVTNHGLRQIKKKSENVPHVAAILKMLTKTLFCAALILFFFDCRDGNLTIKNRKLMQRIKSSLFAFSGLRQHAVVINNNATLVKS